MTLEIRQVGPDALPLFAQVSIAFRVDSVLQVEPVDGGLGGLSMREVPAPDPYMKDYDALDGDTPAAWARRWDISNWAFFMAFEDGRPVGGAAVAFDTPGLHLLDERRDIAGLWDIRVQPDMRGRGVGTALIRRVADWARSRGCTHLKIETQNVNARACRFYAKQGCTLGAIDRFGYAGDPRVAHEAMLLWYLDLRRPRP